MKHIPDLRTTLFLAILVIAELTASFELSMILAALKSLLEQFGRPVAVGWVVTAYFMVASAAAAIGGRLGDIFGRSMILKISLLCAGLGSCISALSPNLEGIILGRIIQGLSGAILPLCYGLLQEHLPANRIPFGIGILSAAAALGSGGGLILGGVLVDYGGWQLIFVASGGTAFLALGLFHLFVPASKKSETSAQVDILGGVMFVPGLVALMLAVSNVSSWGIFDWRFISLIAGGITIVIFWVIYELRHPSPLINLRLLANRNIAITNICMALAAIGAMSFPQMFMLLLTQPLWTGVGLGVSATVAGLLKLPSNIISALVAPAAGHFLGQHAKWLIVAGMIMTSIGWASFLLNISSISLVQIIIFSALYSLGTTMFVVAAPIIIVLNAPADRTSEATGFMMVVRSVFHGVGGQILIVLLATSTTTGDMATPGEFPTAAGFRLAIAVMAFFCFMSALFAFGLSGSHKDAIQLNRGP